MPYQMNSTPFAEKGPNHGKMRPATDRNGSLRAGQVYSRISQLVKWIDLEPVQGSVSNSSDLVFKCGNRVTNNEGKMDLPGAYGTIQFTKSLS